MKTIDKLNKLLSDIQIFYMNTRGYHWNIKGDKFFVLHAKFEELYNDLAEKADEVAERILMLGGTPVHSYSKYIEQSDINESENKSTAEATVSEVVRGLGTLLRKEKEILEISSEAKDEGTVALMSDYISSQEKALWMYKSYLSA